MKTDDLIANASQKLASKRLDLIVANDGDLTEVVAHVNDTLLSYFHPLTGGEDGIQGVPRGRLLGLIDLLSLFLLSRHGGILSIRGLDRSPHRSTSKRARPN